VTSHYPLAGAALETSLGQSLERYLGRAGERYTADGDGHYAACSADHVGRCAYGLIALPLCTTAPPLHTRSTEVIGGILYLYFWNGSATI
jgi:hypothetical protein